MLFQPSQSLALGFSGGSESKELACNAGDLGLIPGQGRSPGEGNGYPLQYSCWRIPLTEESYGLQSKGSQRVRHNSATNTFIFTHTVNQKNVRQKWKYISTSIFEDSGNIIINPLPSEKLLTILLKDFRTGNSSEASESSLCLSDSLTLTLLLSVPLKIHHNVFLAIHISLNFLFIALLIDYYNNNCKDLMKMSITIVVILN